MKTVRTLALIFLFVIPSWTYADTIAEVATKQVLENYLINKTDKKISFDLTKLTQEGKYAVLSSPAFFIDGTSTINDIEDLLFVFCLQEEKHNTWKLAYDLSRSDVPSDGELIQIKNSFPENFPRKLLSTFWQDLLK